MGLNEALSAWRELLGGEYVITGSTPRAEVETATFYTSQSVPAIVRPGSREELQGCLRIANRFKTPVYPVSAGKNWGYGSRVPATDGCVVIALDRLDRILDFDEQLAYITLEPGVTFAQANRFLRERRSDLMLNSPGSTAEASVIGNAVERGIAGGLGGERAAQVCGLEVVLPTGECISTGFERFEKALAAKVFAHGVGPSLDGLFFQSNLGIVTRLTHWLTPLPKFYRYFSFAIKSAARFSELVDKLQPLKREGPVETNLGLYNDYKILTYLRQFPPPRAQDEKLNLGDLPAEYLAPLKGYAWFGEGAITAPDDEIGAAKSRLLVRRLSGSVDQLMLKEQGAENVLVGTSLATGLSSVYWRKNGLPPGDMNPDRDRCGLLWLCPVAPFRGESLARCVSLIEETMSSFQFEPVVGVQCHSPRAAHVVASIVYDRDQPGQDSKALDCHDTLLKRLVREGFIPYRLTTRGMGAASTWPDVSASLMKSLKRLLDPSDILAPGRYD